MNRTPRPRRTAVAVALLLALGAAPSLVACTPPAWTWKGGTTHGAIIEPTAGRASVGIYRVPRKALRDVYGSGGIRLVQDFIWAFGAPPAVSKTFSYQGRSLTLSFGTKALRSQAHSLIYDHASDLRSALLESHAAHDCLALTLISYGAPAANWTHKQVGCQMGSLP